MKPLLLRYRPSVSLTVLLLLIFGSVAWADIYKWTDEKGVIHFSDQPPAQNQGTQEVESQPSAPPSTYQPPPKKEPAETNASAKEAPPPTPKATPRANPTVELYVTSWCKYCKMARNYLKTRSIPFNEYDIEKDAQAAARRRQLDPRSGVPLAVINGRTIIGFSEQSYDWALKQTN
ncbi:MAG: DUF4124 domain-containing protein [Desulfobacteraceae bacterium]|nr:DUF4124 domain-containing protein [Desulfobacteraceae bacterium]